MTFALGGGQTKQDSSSWGTSSSEGYSSAVSGDTSRSAQESLSGSTSGQQIAFADLFAKLYGGASTAATSAVAQAPQLSAIASQLFTGGSKFLEGLGGDAGTQYMQSRLSSENPVLNEQINQLQTDTGRFFTEELNPAITSRSVSGGTLGGGRQGVAQGLAAGRAADAFTRGATTLRAGDVAARDAIAATVAGNSLTAANTGLGALSPLMDIADRGANAELGVYSTLSGIMGGPTTLTSSDAFSRSTAQSLSDAFSRSYGEQSSQSEQGSKSKGRAWNFNTQVGIGK